jgi:hypothetical protein
MRVEDRERLRAAIIGCVEPLLPRAEECAAVSAMLTDHCNGRNGDVGIWVHAPMDTMRMLVAIVNALLLLAPGVPFLMIAEYLVCDTREDRGFFVRIRPCRRHRGQ